MSAFDTRLNIVGIHVQGLATDPETPEALTATEIVLINAAMVAGPEGAVPFPVGQYKFGLSAEMTKDLIDELQKTLDELVPPKPKANITIATDLNEANKAAQRAQQLRG